MTPTAGHYYKSARLEKAVTGVKKIGGLEHPSTILGPLFRLLLHLHLDAAASAPLVRPETVHLSRSRRKPAAIQIFHLDPAKNERRYVFDSASFFINPGME